MTLFDEITRRYRGPAKYAEPSFDYLNRSARPEAETIRQTLEGWFARYPQSGHADLRGRFRSRDERQHQSAFFELLLHEVLLQFECYTEIHPEAPHGATRRHPDFLVESSQGSSFYMEAVVVTGLSEEASAARARTIEVYDALNRLDSPDFFIGMNIRGAPASPPSARDMRVLLRRALEDLDADEIAHLWKLGGVDAVPHWPYEHEGWKVDFYPIPKSPGLRGTLGIRPIGLRISEGHFADAATPIRDAIVDKAGAYWDFEIPYVVAVNYLGEDLVDQSDIMSALFGRERYEVSVGRNGVISEPKLDREPNGLWMSRSGPRRRRLSAVLLAVRLIPSTVGQAGVWLVHNPWATNPYSSELTRLPQGVPQEGHIEWRDGLSLSQALGLKPGWPFASATAETG